MKFGAYFLGFVILFSSGVAGFSDQAKGQTVTKKSGGRTVSKKGQFKATGWAVKCSKPTKKRAGGCQLTHAVVQPSKKRVLVGTRIRYSRVTKSYVMVLQMPHGLIIPKGVLIAIDKSKPVGVKIFTSDRNGVYSTMGINPRFIARLKNGTTMIVSFVASNTQRVTVPVSLKGFTAGFNKLSK